MLSRYSHLQDNLLLIHLLNSWYDYPPISVGIAQNSCIGKIHVHWEFKLRQLLFLLILELYFNTHDPCVIN